jgi:hypothetical protein
MVGILIFSLSVQLAVRKDWPILVQVELRSATRLNLAIVDILLI